MTTPELEYTSSDSLYHDAPMAATSRILMVPVGDLEISQDASEAEVPTDALMEGGSSEDLLMSPLHQEEEEVLPIVGREEFDLMMRVLDDQPILGSSVSGQRCIRSAGALPLSKYHPYVHSSYFKGQLRGLPSTEAFRSNYLQAIRTGGAEVRRSGREADDELSGTEGLRSSVEPEGLDDSPRLGVNASSDGSSSDPTTLASLARESHGDGRGIGWSWSFGRRDLGHRDGGAGPC